MKKVLIPILITLGILLFLGIAVVSVFIFMGYNEYGENNSSDTTESTYLPRAETYSGLQLKHGNVVRFSDTKGGFFGEGDVFLEIQYSQEEYKDIESQISTNEHWNELPMDEELSEHLLGFDFEFPQNGYYLFYDRHSEADSHYDYKEMPKRHSMNFSVTLLDRDTNKLIYIEIDT